MQLLALQDIYNSRRWGEDELTSQVRQGVVFFNPLTAPPCKGVIAWAQVDHLLQKYSQARSQMGKGRVMTSRNRGGVMDSTLVRNARDVGLIPALCIICPTIITPLKHTHKYIYIYIYMPKQHSSLYLCIYMCICIYVYIYIVIHRRGTSSRGTQQFTAQLTTARVTSVRNTMQFR